MSEPRQDNILDLLNLVGSNLDANNLVESLQFSDIILLLSYKRVEEDTFDTYKSLLQQLGAVMGPYLATQKEFNANLFSTDLSKLKINQLEAFVLKRLNLYPEDLLQRVEDLLNQA